MSSADYLFWFLAGIVSGILLGSYYELALALLAAVSFFGAFLLVWAAINKKSRQLALSFFILGVLIGILRISFSDFSQSKNQTVIPSLILLRDRFEQSLNRFLPEPEVSFAAGIILGKARKFPQELYEAMRKTSTIHLVAVSGYNITVVAVSILRMLELLTIHRKLAWWIAVFGILFFTLFVGAPASTIRAAIMGFLVLLAKRIGRVSSTRNALALAAAAMLLWNPIYLRWDLGFQLSFLATIGILYVSPVMLGKISTSKNLTPTKPGQMKEIISDTISAQLMVAPWIFYTFGTISLVGAAANILILPLIPVSMFLSFLTGLLGLLSDATGTLFGILSLPVFNYSIWIIKAFSQLPFSEFSLSKPSLFAVILSYIAIAYIFFYPRKKLQNV